MQSIDKAGNATADAILVYILTNACNFRCCYCYENKKNTSVKTPFHTRFQFADLLKTYHIFCKKYGIPKSIVFFGGEPLLEKELIYKFVAELKNEKGDTPDFATITNASLMDEKWIKFMADNFSAVTFSLDGTQTINDEFRLDTAGQGTYQHVVENIRKFQEKNNHTKVTVEATLTKAYGKVDDVESACKETWNLFHSLNIPIMDYIPVEGNEFSLFQAEKTEIAQKVVYTLVDLWFHDLVSLHLTTDVIAFHSQLLSLIKKQKPYYGCGAGRNYFAVTPDLSIYTCQVALFQGESPKWRFSEDNTIVEINGGFREAGYPKMDNCFCQECECRNGCSCHCHARWGDNIPEKLPDICIFHRMARKRILTRIGELYENGKKELLKTAVVKYYGKKT